MREFSRSWLAGCLLYLAGCICYTFLISTAAVPIFLMFYVLNVLCLYTVLLIFIACSSIDNIPYKKFWAQYPLLLVTYGLAIYMLNIDPFLIALPFFLYEAALISATVFTIIWRWRLSILLRAGFAFFVTVCCGWQMYSCLLVVLSKVSLAIIGVNVVLLLLLNFSFAYLYQRFLKINQSIRDDYLYTLAEKAVDIVFYYTLKPYPRFTFISPSVESIVGYRQNDFYKNPKLYLELTHEDDREIMRKALSKEADSINKNIVRWQKSDSEYIYLEFHNMPIFSGDELIAIEGVLQDVTDKKIVEQEMIDSKRSRQLLLSYISHELKTPITYIVGYAEALQKNLFSGDQERVNSIDLIYTKAVFLQNLVEDLFQLSKMESNQFSFEFMQTKVYALCRYIADKHLGDIKSTKIRYFCQIDESLKDERYEVLVDLKRIYQVFANLLNNSIKHMPGDGTISFFCMLDEKKENLVMKLADTGIGIPEEDLPYIFKAFYRGKAVENRAAPGSGLGLSLSRQIMLSHKGNIEARSTVDKGSIFIITIPLYKEEHKNR